LIPPYVVAILRVSCKALPTLARLVAGGVVSGIAAALALSRVLRSFLFDVEPTDPATLISVGLLFAGVAMLACWAPARRAVRVDPLEALRYE
jgi:putative ABC transport system permease protein